MTDTWTSYPAANPAKLVFIKIGRPALSPKSKKIALKAAQIRYHEKRRMNNRLVAELQDKLDSIEKLLTK